MEGMCSVLIPDDLLSRHLQVALVQMLCCTARESTFPLHDMQHLFAVM